jgi:hypothetical protein
VGSVGFILIMVGRTGWDLAVYAASFVLDLGVAFALAGSAHLGAEGAAVAQAITMTFSNAARLYLVWRFVGIQPFTPHYARLAIPATVAAAVMLGVHHLVGGKAWPVDLVATGLAGAAAYLGVLAVSALTPGERRALSRLVRGGAA